MQIVALLNVGNEQLSNYILLTTIRYLHYDHKNTP